MNEIQAEAQARKTFISDLRDVAAFLEQNPDVPLPTNRILRAKFWSTDPNDLLEAAKKTARALNTFKKEFDQWDMQLEKRVGTFKLVYAFDRDGVCTKTQTGTKKVVTQKLIVPEGAPPPEYEEVTEDEPIYSYDCPSLLGD